MVFSSTIFLFAFLPVLLVVYFNPFFKGRRFRNVVLLLASIAFYAWGEPVFVFVMMAMVVINWLIGLALDRPKARTKLWTAIAVILDVGLLVVFKYLTFITENIAYLSGRDGIIVEIALPIGISFFTFQMMSYIFDVAGGKARAQRNLLDVMLYITMFPQLIAGPIVRYETVEKAILERTESREAFAKGTVRFIRGLAKKVLIANHLAILADTVFDNAAGGMSVMTAWLGAVAYTLQIYFDFSGYSDMAIGLGGMFGFCFPENFDRPYISASISEFWRRWHISMGTWFRDYVYFPLGGSRVKTFGRNVLNLFIVWLLTGLWHGANWTFVIWGILQFVLIVAEKALHIDKNGVPFFGHIYSIFFIVTGWTIFRADTVVDAGRFLLSMFGAGTGFCDEKFTGLIGQYWYLLIIGAVLSVIKVKPAKKQAAQVISGALYGFLFLVTVTFIVKGGYNPFIYFNF